jgi:aspartate/tyrosine/aromatic aminotransferase
MCEICVTGRNGAEFLQRVLGYKVAYYSDPTWGNHGLIFRNANFTDVRKHQYWDKAAKGLNFRHGEQIVFNHKEGLCRVYFLKGEQREVFIPSGLQIV